jgi:nucleotide-binding universal stress UspA family protein
LSWASRPGVRIETLRGVLGRRERMPARVLLATDASKDAALAARAAVDACKGTGAELHVVHAWHSVPSARLRPFMRTELKKLGNELLEEGVKRVEDAGGLVTDTHLVEGRAADEILDLAGRIGAGLIVIGSRGLGPVGRIALGSVSEAVIHHSRCPVLVLRGGEDAWPPEWVIFGDDGSEAARAAGDLGASLCGGRGVRAQVLHAYPRLPEVDAEGRGLDPRIVDDELRRAEKALLERSRELESRLGSRPRTRLAVGDAAACLLEAAEEDVPERTLVAVGSRALGAIGRMRLGSVSTKVVHAAKGPVLVHPPLQEDAT